MWAKNPFYPPAVEQREKFSILPEGTKFRQVEQDHRRVKHLINLGMSFASFNSA